MRKNYILMLSLFCISASAQYDGFLRTGALVGADGWENHSGTTPIVMLTTASDSGNSLNYSGATAPTGNRIGMSTAISEDANKKFTTTQTSTAYVSFFLKITDEATFSANTLSTPPGYIAHFSPNSGTSIGTTNFVSRLSMRKGSAAGKFNMGILNTTGGSATITDIYGSATPAEYNVNTTYFVVIKYDMTGATGVSSLWVNPTISSEANPIVSSSFGTSSKSSQVDSFAIRNSTTTGVWEMDELRMGASWAEVVGATLKVTDVKSDSKIISNTLVKDQFRILAKGNSFVEIYNGAGGLVKKLAVGNNEPVFVNELRKGVYFVKVLANGKAFSAKIIKE